MASCCSDGSSLVSCACGCPGCRPHLISDSTAEEEAVFSQLTSIPKIQDYLDSLKYEAKPDGAWSPRMTIRWGHAHCFGGSLFAAAAMRNLGNCEHSSHVLLKTFFQSPLKMRPASSYSMTLTSAAHHITGHRPYLVHLSTDPEVDDDHVICAYQVDGYWGAVAKSNYSTLRGRDPVYQSIRELAMSYFDFYFSSAKVKSMTGYSDPVALEQFDDRGPGKKGWMYAEDSMEDLDRVLCYEGVTHCIIASPPPISFSKGGLRLKENIRSLTVNKTPDSRSQEPICGSSDWMLNRTDDTIGECSCSNVSCQSERRLRSICDCQSARGFVAPPFNTTGLFRTQAPHYTVVTSKMVPHLNPATKELFEASTLFTNWDGLFKPKSAPA